MFANLGWPLRISARSQAGDIAISTIMRRFGRKGPPPSPAATSRVRVVRTGVSTVSASTWAPAASARHQFDRVEGGPIVRDAGVHPGPAVHVFEHERGNVPARLAAQIVHVREPPAQPGPAPVGGMLVHHMDARGDARGPRALVHG